MGTEAAWVPWVLAAVSAAGTAYNTNQTEHKQDNALADMLRQEGSRQHEADAKVADLLNKQSQSTDTDERASALDSFTRQIEAKRANTQLQQPGALSDAQRSHAADAALGVSDYGQKIAGLLASIDAPGQQRQNEAIDQTRFGQDIDRIKRFSAGDDFLAKMRLQGIKANPWISLASGVAGGAASATAANQQGIAVGEPSPYGPYAGGYKYPKGYAVSMPSYFGG